MKQSQTIKALSTIAILGVLVAVIERSQAIMQADQMVPVVCIILSVPPASGPMIGT
jgi:hypothetical protein